MAVKLINFARQAIGRVLSHFSIMAIFYKILGIF